MKFYHKGIANKEYPEPYFLGNKYVLHFPSTFNGIDLYWEIVFFRQVIGTKYFDCEINNERLTVRFDYFTASLWAEISPAITFTLIKKEK